MEKQTEIQKTTVYIEESLFARVMNIAAKMRIYSYSRVAAMAIREWVERNEEHDDDK